MLAARRWLEDNDLWAVPFDVASIAAGGQAVQPSQDVLGPPADLTRADRAGIWEEALSDETIQCGSVLVAGQEKHIVDGEQGAGWKKALMHDVTFRVLRRRHDVSGCASGQCA